jgi:hypothetical protein
MTRAVQTAFLACRDHPSLSSSTTEEEENNIKKTEHLNSLVTLLRCLRERKGRIGSFDCVGKRVGKNIVKGAKEHMSTLMNDEMEEGGASFDCNDCESEWWTSATSHDTEVS